MNVPIHVIIYPGDNILTQYVRRLLLDTIRGIKDLTPTQHLKTDDILKITKINDTKKPISLFFHIKSYDGSFPETSAKKWKWDCHENSHPRIPIYRSLDQLEASWDENTFLNVGKELQEKNV